MNEKKEMNNNGVAKTDNGQQTEWVFIPLPKDLVIKKTEKYVLFQVGDNISSIVSAKFKRKKESENFIYLSVPANYMFGIKETRYNEETHKWETMRQKDLSAKLMRKYLNYFDEDEVMDNEWNDIFPEKSTGNPNLDAVDLPDDDLPF